MRWDAYPKYKDSGIEWLGEIPEHWEIWKVTHGFRKIGSGITPKSDALAYYGGDIPWVTTSELRENIIPITNTMLTSLALEDYRSLKIYLKGTLLIAMYGATIGRLGILGIPATVNQACCAFSEPIVFYTKFFFYWLMYRRPILIALSEGGGQPNLSQDILKFLRVPLPPMQEQDAIAAFLDRETARIDALIAKKQRQIELLKEKRAALISHAVTKGLNPKVKMKDSGIEWLGKIPEHWFLKSVKYLTRILRGKFTHRPRNDPRMYDGPYPFIQTGNVAAASKYICEYHQTLSEEGFAISKMFSKGTLVMTIAANIGDMAILDFEACFPDSIVGFVPQSDVELDYLYYLFLSMRQTLLGTATLNTQLNLNIERIGSIVAGHPPQDEQRAIVAFLDRETDRIDALIEKIRQSIDLLREYRTALISAAVTGKIDVRKEVA